MNFFVVDRLLNKTVVIADSDNVARSLLRGALRTIGLDVLDEARTGSEVLRQIARHRPSVVCLDFEMPELSGLEVLAKIRQTDKAVIVLIISSLASADNVKAAIQAGADGFVGKPFNTAKIKAAIERALALREGRPVS
jgi:two-component system chemotaxis response regulator CheY